MEQQKADKIFFVLLVIFAIWGIYYIYLGMTGAFSNYELFKDGQKIQGVISQVGESSQIAGTPAKFLGAHKVVAVFKTNIGQQLSITGEVNALIFPVVGNNITVLYNYKEPKLSRIYDPINIWGSTIFFLIVGFALVYAVIKYQIKKKTNPQSLVDIEQRQFDKFQQNTAKVNPYGFLGAQNPHVVRNVILLFVIIFGGIILLSISISFITKLF